MTFWRDIVAGGRTYDMTHLHPFEMSTVIGDVDVRLSVNFGWHVFTDEKGQGKPFRWGDGSEERYFSVGRYNTSHQTAQFVRERMVTAYVRPYFDKSQNENYFCLDTDDLAIFLAVHKSSEEANLLKCRVISAYEVDQWGREGLPKGKAYKMRYVLDMRNQGHSVNSIIKAGRNQRR